MSVFNINPDQMISQTTMFKTMVLSADGKSITMNNKTHVFRIRALPATVSLRLLKKYPIETVSWCYLGMPLKKSDVFLFGSMCLNKSNLDTGINEAQWESLDMIDTAWSLFLENKCIECTTIENKNVADSYMSLGSIISNGAYDESNHDLLELMTMSTYIIRLSVDSFFLNYTEFLKQGQKMSMDQQNIFGQAIQDTFLEVLEMVKTHIKETGSSSMKNLRKKATK